MTIFLKKDDEKDEYVYYDVHNIDRYLHPNFSNH